MDKKKLIENIKKDRQAVVGKERYHHAFDELAISKVMFARPLWSSTIRFQEAFQIYAMYKQNNLDYKLCIEPLEVSIKELKALIKQLEKQLAEDKKTR